MLKVEQEVVIFDTDRDSHIGDIRISVRTTIKEPFVFLPEQELHLTKEGIVQLLEALTSASYLTGQDFIVHHDGSIAITHDDGTKLVDTNYANLDEYLEGQ